MSLLAAVVAAVLSAATLRAEEPYFITYSHTMEEPGNLEIASSNTFGHPAGGNRFANMLVELEYGVKAWWTSELYLSGQTTSGESTLFTGYRLENRMRPLRREHWINPVLYFEFENINGADKSLKEVVGHDDAAGTAEPNSKTRVEKKREIEAKLILSSRVKGWNISENFIAEKNLAGEPWEFGYAAGVSRPLALAASANDCRWCRENFAAGLEMYGGLGDRYRFGLKDTSHYIAPTLAWTIPNGPAFKVSPGFGLTASSQGFLMRIGIAYEINQLGQTVKRMLR